MSFGSGGSESSRTIGKQSNVDDLAKDEELGFEDRNRGVQGRGSDLLVAKNVGRGPGPDQSLDGLILPILCQCLLQSLPHN